MPVMPWPGLTAGGPATIAAATSAGPASVTSNCTPSGSYRTQTVTDVAALCLAVFVSAS